MLSSEVKRYTSDTVNPKTPRVVLLGAALLILAAGAIVFTVNHSSDPSEILSSSQLGGGAPSTDLAGNSTAGTADWRPGDPASPRPGTASSSVFTRPGAVSAGTFAPGIEELPSTAPEGTYARATVMVSGKALASDLAPDLTGTYPQIQLEPDAEIEVSLNFPKELSGQQLVIQAQDGGTCLGSGAKVDVTGIAANGSASFRLAMDANPGIYRFSLHRGDTVHDLDFWVGTRPSVSP